MGDAAGVTAGQRILDVACGTGIVVRTAADGLGAANVVGFDLNDAMLTVARCVRPGIDWSQGDVAFLPFDDGSFDVVARRMGLMFFPDRITALQERPESPRRAAPIVVMVPSSLDAQPADGPFVDMAAEHARAEAWSLLSNYFPMVDALVTTEVDSTPLAERITSDVYDQIRDEARCLLAPFTAADGHLEAPFEAHVVAARRS